MARKFSVAAIVAVLAAAAALQSAYAATYTVGGTTGWIVPPSANFFSEWASNSTFKVGDVLEFNFGVGYHTVATVTKAVFESCTTSNPISIVQTPPVKITLNSSGDHYFFCTVAKHCANGQKLKVEVSSGSGSGSPPPAASPSPSGPPTSGSPPSGSPTSGSPPSDSPTSGTSDSPASPPSSPSAAAPLVTATFTVLLTSIAAVLLC